MKTDVELKMEAYKMALAIAANRIMTPDEIFKEANKIYNWLKEA